jgi:hypothetical protein
MVEEKVQACRNHMTPVTAVSSAQRRTATMAATPARSNHCHERRRLVVPEHFFEPAIQPVS